jgi:hypothetical protein
MGRDEALAACRRGSIIAGVTPATPISVEYNLTPRERTEGRSALIRPEAANRRPLSWKALIGWMLFILLAVLVYFMLRNYEARLGGPHVERPVETAPAPATTPADARAQRLRLIALAACTGSAAVFVAVDWASYLLARREQRARDSGGGRHRTTYTFADDALIETSGAKTTRLYWPAFHSFAETDRLFVVRNSPDQGPVIPKRLFASEAQVSQVRELLVRKLTPPPLPESPAAPPEVR